MSPISLLSSPRGWEGREGNIAGSMSLSPQHPPQNPTLWTVCHRMASREGQSKKVVKLVKSLRPKLVKAEDSEEFKSTETEKLIKLATKAGRLTAQAGRLKEILAEKLPAEEETYVLFSEALNPEAKAFWLCPGKERPPRKVPSVKRDSEGRLLHLGMWVDRDHQLTCTYCRGIGSNCPTCWGVKTYCAFCRFCGQCGVDHHEGESGRLLRAAQGASGNIPLCTTHTTQYCDEQTAGCSISRAGQSPRELARFRFECSHCPQAYRTEGDLVLHSHKHLTTNSPNSTHQKGEARAVPRDPELTHTPVNPIATSPEPVRTRPEPQGLAPLPRLYPATQGTGTPRGPPDASFPPLRDIPSYQQWGDDWKEVGGPQALQNQASVCSVCQGRHCVQGEQGKPTHYYACHLLPKIKSREVALANMTCRKCLCLKEYHCMAGAENCWVVETKSKRWNLLCGKAGHGAQHHKICHACYVEQNDHTARHLASLQRKGDPFWKGKTEATETGKGQSCVERGLHENVIGLEALNISHRTPESLVNHPTAPGATQCDEKDSLRYLCAHTSCHLCETVCHVSPQSPACRCVKEVCPFCGDRVCDKWLSELPDDKLRRDLLKRDKQPAAAFWPPWPKD